MKRMNNEIEKIEMKSENEKEHIVAKRIAKLIDVKSIVTLTMTAGLLVAMFVPNFNPPKELLALYCTSYGAIITYFFTKDNKAD